MNQTHSKFTRISTWTGNDDKNAAAVQIRGPNTSYGTGRNFQNVPMGQPDQQGWDPVQWHYTTAHIRWEPTWTNPPQPMGAWYKSRGEPRPNQ